MSSHRAFHRREEQKGVDILLASLPKAVAANKNAQFIILGTGKAAMEKQVSPQEVARSAVVRLRLYGPL